MEIEATQETVQPLSSPLSASSLGGEGTTSITEQEIEYAMNLDFNRRPRLTRHGDKEVIINPTIKQPNDKHRSFVLHLMHKWGWNPKEMTCAEQNKLAMAATTQISFDFGFTTPMRAQTIIMAYKIGQSTNKG